jgi:two-component system, NtrC family, sensor kinase
MTNGSNRDIPPDATVLWGREAVSKPLKAKLVNMDGFLDHELKELVIPLENGEKTVGRDQANTVCIPHKKISRRHMRIYPDSGQWVVEDLGSTNGMLVNGEKKDAARLKPGDVVKIGALSFRFEVEAKSAAGNSDIGAMLLGGDRDSLSGAKRSTPRDDLTVFRLEPDAPEHIPDGSSRRTRKSRWMLIISGLMIAGFLLGLAALFYLDIL